MGTGRLFITAVSRYRMSVEVGSFLKVGFDVNLPVGIKTEGQRVVQLQPGGQAQRYGVRVGYYLHKVGSTHVTEATHDGEQAFAEIQRMKDIGENFEITFKVVIEPYADENWEDSSLGQAGGQQVPGIQQKEQKSHLKKKKGRDVAVEP